MLMIITHINLVLPVCSVISLSKSARIFFPDTAAPVVHHFSIYSSSWRAGSYQRQPRGSACQVERGLPECDTIHWTESHSS